MCCCSMSHSPAWMSRCGRIDALLQESPANRNISVLSVTHDVAEAFQLGAEVIKIADGKVVAQGPVEVVLAEERKRLLEQLGGVNLA